MVYDTQRKIVSGYGAKYDQGVDNLPTHNGIISSDLPKEDITIACKYDLLIRMIMTIRSFVHELLTSIAKVTVHNKDTLLLENQYLVSLLPERLGAYKHINGVIRFSSLVPNGKHNKKFLQDAEQNKAGYGYNVITLLPLLLQCNPENLIPNLPDSIVKKLNAHARFTFCEKTLYYRVEIPKTQFPIGQKSLIWPILEDCYPVVNGYIHFHQYPYHAENGAIEFVLLEFFNNVGEIVRLPITAWQYTNPKICPDICYDTLNMAPPYPLYKLPDIVNNRGKKENALILHNEKDVEYICKVHNWITQQMPCTTYSVVHGTNFKPLYGLNVLILPKESKAGYQEAFCVYNELVEYGISASFLLPDYPDMNNQSLNSLSPSILESAINTKVSFKDFAKIARDKYGIQPPEGLLPKAVSLNDILESGSKEMLLKELLILGHQATMIASRGIGKSIFMLYVTICLILKIVAFSGQICPSRQYKVLFIDYEMTINEILERVNDISSKMGLTEEQVAYVKDKIRIRSAIDENEDLHLDTEEGWLSVLPDINEAEIIIVDSLHWAFPSAMSTEIGDTQILNKRYKWCKQNGKSLIVLDHPSKTGNSAYGSIGKDIGLDTVLFLDKAKNGTISIKMTKNRHFSDENPTWANFKLSDIIAAKSSVQALSNDDAVSTDSMDDAASVDSTDDAVSVDSTDKLNLKDLNEALPITTDEELGREDAILALRTQHPNDTKADFIRQILNEGIAGRSTAYEIVGALELANKLAFG